MEERGINPLQMNWQYMKYAGSMLNRHENHVVVNDNGTVTWDEFSVSCEPVSKMNVAAIRTVLESAINGLVAGGLARDVTHDIVAEEALDTLTLTLATATATTVVHKRQALVSECIFVASPLSCTPTTIIPLSCTPTTIITPHCHCYVV